MTESKSMELSHYHRIGELLCTSELCHPLYSNHTHRIPGGKNYPCGGIDCAPYEKLNSTSNSHHHHADGPGAICCTCTDTGPDVYRVCKKTLKPSSSEEGRSYRQPIEYRFDLIPAIALRALASIFEEGARKYGPVAFMEKDLPYSVVVNHMLNHLTLYQCGNREEDHLAKVLWGAVALVTLEAEKPHMNDLTSYGVQHNGMKDG